MQHPFTALAPEYTSLLATVNVRPERERELMERAEIILTLSEGHQSEGDEVEGATGVPKLWGIPSFERESSSDYRCSPAQGDRWNEVSIHVPRGLGPYANWGTSCEAAYRIDHLDQVGAANWTWPRALFEGELYNGFGPRAHGIHTGYLWAWTNLYTEGKYVA